MNKKKQDELAVPDLKEFGLLVRLGKVLYALVWFGMVLYWSY